MSQETVSRRQLFARLSVEKVRETVHDLEVTLPGYLRPPGAVDARRFVERCTACEACVDACGHGSVYVLQTDDVHDGTPVMAPGERPCHMCDGFPCAAACDEEALIVPEDGVWKLGDVQISERHCITFMGPECGACSGLCPTEEPAIRMVAWRPEVQSELCVGCGLCLEACPTQPNAIEFRAVRHE